jgi:mannose-6-phosphate isomerase-like protein (cupin superfamily)
MPGVRQAAAITGTRVPFVGRPDERAPVPFLPVIVRAGADETAGSFDVLEIAAPVGTVRDVTGDGPPPHVHREHEEAFYILDGQVTFNFGAETALAPKGTLVVVPPGTSHGFRAEAGSRLLVFAIPGGLADFFEELGAGLAAGRADAEIRSLLAGKYDTYPV